MAFAKATYLANVLNQYDSEHTPSKYKQCKGVPQKKLLQREKEYAARSRRLGNKTYAAYLETENLYWVPQATHETEEHQLLMEYADQVLAERQDKYAECHFTWSNIRAELARREDMAEEYFEEQQQQLLARLAPAPTPAVINFYLPKSSLKEANEPVCPAFLKPKMTKAEKAKKFCKKIERCQRALLRHRDLLPSRRARMPTPPIWEMPAYVRVIGTPAMRAGFNKNFVGLFTPKAPKWFEPYPVLNQAGELKQLFRDMRHTEIDFISPLLRHGETASNKIKEWGNNFVDLLGGLTIDKFEKFFGMLKPINLCNYIAQYIACKDYHQRFSCLMAVAELYDWFWTSNLHFMSTSIIASLMIFFDYLVNKFILNKEEPVPPADELDPIKNQAIVKTEDNDTIFEYFGIDATNIPDSLLWIVGGIFSIVAILTGGKSIKSWKNFNLKNIMSDIRTFANDVKACKSMIDGIPTCFNFMMSAICELFGYTWCSREDKQVSLFQEKLLSFKKEVYQLADDIQANVQAVLSAPHRVQKAQNIMDEIDKIYADLMKQKCNMSSTKVIFDDMRAKLKSIHDWSVTHINSGATKQEPVFIQIAGPPGIGKSSMVDAMAKALGKRVAELEGIPYEDARIYPRNSSEQYWSGYNGQLIVLYDDWGHNKADEDHSDLIKVKNPAKCLLNMSDNEEKGRPFTSKFLIGCSNGLDSWTSAAVKDMGAINRRRDILITACDPNLQEFVKQKGCPPAKEVHEELVDGEMKRISGDPWWSPNNDGQLEKYYKEDFSHLKMWMIPSEEKYRIGDFHKLVSFSDIIDEAMLAYAKYRRLYLKSIEKPKENLTTSIPNTLTHPDCDHLHIEGEKVSPGCGKLYADLYLEKRSIINRSIDEVDVESTASTSTSHSSHWEKATFEDALREISPSTKNKTEKMKDKFDKKFKKYLDKGGDPGSFIDPVFFQPQLPMDDMEAYFAASQMEYDPMINQSLTQEELNHAANAFSFFNFTNAKVYGLFGSPGTGKSVLTKNLFDHYNSLYPGMCQRIHVNKLLETIVDKPVVFIDDVSVTEGSFQAFRSFMAEVYDGETPVQVLICTANKDMVDSYFKTKDEQMMFYRRIQLFTFGFRPKPGLVNMARNRYWDALDVQNGSIPFNDAVFIRDSFATFQAKKPIFITHNQLFDLLKAIDIDKTKFQTVICNYTPVIDRAHVNPSIHIQTEMETFALFSMLYDNPSDLIKPILSGRVKLIKGSISECYRIAQQFKTESDQRPVFPGTIDEFIKIMNSTGQISRIKFALYIELADASYYFTTGEHTDFLRVFKVVDDIDVTENTIRSAHGETPMSTTTEKVYKKYINFRQEILPAVEEGLHQMEREEKQIVGICSFGLEKATEFWPVLIQCIAFLSKLLLSQYSIWNLVKYHLPHLFNSVEQVIVENEAKGKTKFKRRVFRLSKKLYDQAATYLDKYGNDSAKKAGLGKVLHMIHNIYGDDPGELQIKDVVEHYSEGGEWWKFYDETADPLDAIEVVEEIPLVPESGRHDQHPKAKPREARAQLRTDIVWAETKKGKEQEVALLNDIVPKELEKKTLKQIITARPIKNESLHDPSIAQVVPSVVQNMVEFGYLDGGDFKKLNMALMIKGFYGITVYHSVKKDITHCIRFERNGVVLLIPVEKIIHNKALDLAKFKVSNKNCPSFKSIEHWLPTQDYNVNKHIENQFGMLITPTQAGNKTLYGFHPVRTHCLQCIKTEDGWEKENQIKYTGYTAGVEFDSLVGTQPGDCGCPLLLCNPNSVTVKIIGIHGAANSSVGFASYLFKEFFSNETVQNQALIDTLTMEGRYAIVVPKHYPVTFEPWSQLEILKMPVYGITDKPTSHSSASKIWTSPLALPDTEKYYQPSILSPIDNRIPFNALTNTYEKNPYELSVSKWAHEQPQNINEALLHRVVADTCKYFVSEIRNNITSVRKLTKTEALNSCPELNVSQFPRDTSPGFPWTQIEPDKGKYLTNTGDYYKINLDSKPGRILNSSIDELIDICRQNLQKPLVMFSTALKDEVLKKSKIDECNTRSFAGAPFDYAIAYRMYFGAAIGAIIASRKKLPPQVGMDPVASLDFHSFVMDLLATSDIGFDADFKQWDASVVKAFLRFVPVVYNEIYSKFDSNFNPVDNLVRLNLHAALWSPFLLLHTAENTTSIVQAPGGMVSGQPGTAMDNSIVHFMKVLYAYYIIMEEKQPDLANFAAFRHYVNVKVYGDDGVYAVHPEIIDLFNYFSFEKVMKELNMTCTPAAKDGKPQAYIKVLDFEFLKRKIKRRGAFWVGVLSEGSFYKMLGYCFGPPHSWWRERQPLPSIDMATMEGTMNSCLQEAALHGPEYFEKFYKHFDDIITNKNWPIVLPSIEDVHSTMGWKFQPWT